MVGGPAHAKMLALGAVGPMPARRYILCLEPLGRRELSVIGPQMENEIVHVYETREQIEFNDQTPLLESNPSKNGGNTH